MFKTIRQCQLDLVAHSVGIIGEMLDDFPCSAARVSFGKEDKTGKDSKADRKLMQYLADHEHMSPFEHQSATFLVEVPLFIRSQIMRHRTFSYNEISRRYTDENLEFWTPSNFRKQAASNRQASSPDELVLNNLEMCRAADRKALEDLEFYEKLIEEGVCREQARAYLPQSLLTKFYMTGNLRNWSHFVDLRLGDGAQEEVKIVAERIDEHLTNLWPTAWGVLRGK